MNRPSVDLPCSSTRTLCSLFCSLYVPSSQDQECQVCKESTGLVCQKSKPGVDGGCSGKGDTSNYGKITSTLLADGEEFEYTANDKSFEYITAEARRMYLQSIRI